MINSKAFTLIELLIVVAIIAILAAIAVPNFLEAQTRSKVSRVKSDMRTVATALEVYFIDNNKYPYKRGPLLPGLTNNGTIRGSWVPQNLSTDRSSVTTPISYITTVPTDVFNVGSLDLTAAGIPASSPAYGFRYCRIVPLLSANILTNDLAGNGGSDISGIEVFGFTTREQRYGQWFMLSSGPDRDMDQFTFDFQYDPTNGTVSNGDVLNSQKYGFGPHPIQ